MLEFRNVTIQYGNDLPVLNHFSLSLEKGEIISLVGESGSGKSTVLNAALGLLPGKGRITEGDILLDGNSVLGLNEKKWQRIRGSKAAAVPQDAGAALDPIMPVGKQFVEYLCTHEAADKKTAGKQAVKMLEDAGLPDAEHVMESYPFQLSGGQRQRVGIAMAMALHPDYLLADEPTSALDTTTQAQIVVRIRELRRRYEAGILLITHNLALAAYLSDQIYVLKEGRLVDSGTREEILNHPHSRYTEALIRAVPCLGGDRYV
ncbi:MAG: ABC transporter ATP-binding protein [Lachnospiraceae bacterium]|nr:ABC transporter ATP-binding protein [Lachnospiraceae bacterium]